jgi:hypothetical protein
MSSLVFPLLKKAYIRRILYVLFEEVAIAMPKSKINITMDQDLIEYAKTYASKQRTTVSEVFTQFILNLKRVHEEDPMQIFIDDPEFRDCLLKTMGKIQSGETKWSGYNKVF